MSIHSIRSMAGGFLYIYISKQINLENVAFLTDFRKCYVFPNKYSMLCWSSTYTTFYKDKNCFCQRREHTFTYLYYYFNLKCIFRFSFAHLIFVISQGFLEHFHIAQLALLMSRTEKTALSLETRKTDLGPATGRTDQGDWSLIIL